MNNFNPHNIRDVEEAFFGLLTKELFKYDKSSNGLTWADFNNKIKSFISNVLNSSYPVNEACVQLGIYDTQLDDLLRSRSEQKSAGNLKQYFKNASNSKKRVPYDPQSMNNPTSNNIFSKYQALNKSNSHIVKWGDYVYYMRLYWISRTKQNK